MQPIEYYLERFEAGDAGTAFFGLLELGPQAVPNLTAAYRDETDVRRRELLVDVVSQMRLESAVEFLGDALNDAAPDVWKRAIDGLVTIGTLQAAAFLQRSRERQFSSTTEAQEFNEWVSEALDEWCGSADEATTQGPHD